MSDKKTITVFGAGIAGLTAAHELVVRGFKVEVIGDEPPGLPDGDLPCQIGGMAKTQWSWHIQREPAQPFVSTLRTEPTAPDFIIHFKRHNKGSDDVYANPAAAQKTLRAVADYLKRSDRYCVYTKGWASGSKGKALVERSNRRALKVSRDLKALLGPLAAQADNGIGNAGTRAEDADCVEILLKARFFPGEHGFRFFPAFYRHVFDTMQRTTILDPEPTERSRTVYDNLIPTQALAMGIDRNTKSFPIPRSLPRSIKEVRDLLNNVFEDLRYTPRDISRLQIKIWKYLTSCTERREAEYENISWDEFVDSEQFSTYCGADLRSGPQAIGALRGAHSDARTQGTGTVQLMLDQFGSGVHVDATLNAPTSTAWLYHWQAFLEMQGVTFKLGKLTGFKKNKKGVIEPVVTRPDQEGKQVPVGVEGTSFVLALSLPGIRRLAGEFLRLEKFEDMARIVEFLPQDWEKDLELAQPTGPLQHLSGIQFYFESEINFTVGHTLYLDSNWGLTSISQPQFWGRSRDKWDGYRGLLSVDIANWYQPCKKEDGRPGVPAWEADSDCLAREVWQQVQDAYRKGFLETDLVGGDLPTPIAYHLDDGLRPAGSAAKGLRDATPFLVNRTGEYRKRPGTPGRYHCFTDPRDEDRRWVLAGTYMQTFTRLTSMESANESARHAVNALLEAFEYQGQRCGIFDPEKYEVPDLQGLKDMDRKLFHAGMPHSVDILELERLPQRLVPDSFNQNAEGKK